MKEVKIGAVEILNDPSRQKTNYQAEGLQVFIINKKEKRTYLRLLYFDVNIKNEMFKHSELILQCKSSKVDNITKNKLEEILKIENFNYGDKFFIGLDFLESDEKKKKVLFYGGISSISKSEDEKYIIKAKSLSALLDEAKFFVDYGYKFKVSDFLKELFIKMNKYLEKKANFYNDYSGLYKISNEFLSKEELETTVFYTPVMMYSETYWGFLVRFLHDNLLKLPVYIKGNKIVIGFLEVKKEEEDEEEGEEEKVKEKEEEKKLEFKENEVSEYFELGDYYKGYYIYRSNIIINSNDNVKFFYESLKEDQISSKPIEDYVNKREIPLYLEGKVISSEEVHEWKSNDRENYALYIRQLEEKAKKIKIIEDKIEILKSELKNLGNSGKSGEISKKIEKEEVKKNILLTEKAEIEEKKGLLQKAAKRVGVKIDFNDSLKEEAKKNMSADVNYQEIEFDENGTFRGEKISLEPYPYMLMINTGYSDKNVTTVNTQPDEIVIVLFNLLGEGIIIGATSNQVKEDILAGRIKYKLGDSMIINTKNNVKIETETIDYSVSE